MLIIPTKLTIQIIQYTKYFPRINVGRSKIRILNLPLLHVQWVHTRKIWFEIFVHYMDHASSVISITKSHIEVNLITVMDFQFCVSKLWKKFHQIPRNGIFWEKLRGNFWQKYPFMFPENPIPWNMMKKVFFKSWTGQSKNTLVQ